VADVPAHAGGELAGFPAVLVLEAELAGDHIDDMALGTPVVGEIAGPVFDDAQLHRPGLMRPDARSAGGTRGGKRGKPRPIARRLGHLGQLHACDLRSIVSMCTTAPATADLAYATANRRHSPGTPLRVCAPRSRNCRPEPATRS